MLENNLMSSAAFESLPAAYMNE